MSSSVILTLIPEHIFCIQKNNQDYGSPIQNTENIKNIELVVKKEQTIAQAIYLSGLFEPLPLCSGLGSCTLCRVRYLNFVPEPLNEELTKLSLNDINAGWRLSCLHKVEDSLLLLALPKYARLVEVQVNDTHFSSQKTNDDLSSTLAIDLGTSSVYWAATSSYQVQTDINVNDINANNYEDKIQSGVFLNPQMGAGSDVISRLAYAQEEEKRKQLQDITLKSFRGILKELSNRAFPAPKELCLAANPAMTYITLNKELSGLSSAPYKLSYKGGCFEYLEGLPKLWVAPLLSPFVGGDISAGIAFILFGAKYLNTANSLNKNNIPFGFSSPSYPFMLADLGTNGEFVLCLSPTEAIVSSIPMGPALEGIGLSCGAMASPGVISDFTLNPQGLLAHKLQNTEVEAKSYATQKDGLTATAYLNLLAYLLNFKIINEEGLFSSNSDSLIHPLAKKIIYKNGQSQLLYEKTKGNYLNIDDKVYLSSSDIEEILKVKAAFSLGIKSLLKSAGLEFKDLKNFFLAGALGKHIKIQDLETLGFLPVGVGGQVKNIGNSSLLGAKLFLDYPESRELILNWAKNIKDLELSSQESFIKSYVLDMKFSFY